MPDVPKSLFPFDANWHEHGGLRMHYVDHGEGDAHPPVVMVHGNPTWSFYYRNLIRALGQDRRCIAPDHIGCGFSDKPGDERYSYTLASRVDDLTRLIDALELNQVDLVVHDWGGMIGFAWATLHPDRVRRIVVLNTAAFHNPKGKRIPPGLRLARDSKLGAGLVRGFNAFSASATMVCTKRAPLPSDVARAYRAPYNNWQNRIATLRFVQDIPLAPSDPAWPVVQRTQDALGVLADKPMRIYWGMKDFVFDAAFLTEWERRFPNAAVTRFEDCGHYILEDAADEIIPDVTEFFSA